MEKEKVYSAKRDFLIGLVYLTLIVAITCIAVFFPINFLWQYIFLICFFSIILIAYTVSVFSTYYVFKEDYLLIKSGFFKKKIFYRSIENISASKNLWSSLCLSIDRIKIVYGKYFWQRDFIAPIAQIEVINELENRAKSAREILNYR